MKPRASDRSPRFAAAWLPKKGAENAPNVFTVRSLLNGMKLGGWLHSLGQDVRYGLRGLRLNPGFTAIAVLSLALGTGANTAIFQLIDSLRLRTLPVNNPQQLASVRIVDRSWSSGRIHGRYADVTNAQWEQLRNHQQVFSSMFAWATEGGFNLARGGEARYAEGIWVSGDFFKTLEVPALRGRTLSADDDRRVGATKRPCGRCWPSPLWSCSLPARMVQITAQSTSTM